VRPSAHWWGSIVPVARRGILASVLCTYLPVLHIGWDGGRDEAPRPSLARPVPLPLLRPPEPTALKRCAHPCSVEAQGAFRPVADADRAELSRVHAHPFL
jgi:hypothetical protein